MAETRDKVLESVGQDPLAHLCRLILPYNHRKIHVYCPDQQNLACLQARERILDFLKI